MPTSKRQSTPDQILSLHSDSENTKDFPKLTTRSASKSRPRKVGPQKEDTPATLKKPRKLTRAHVSSEEMHSKPDIYYGKLPGTNTPIVHKFQAPDTTPSQPKPVSQTPAESEDLNEQFENIDFYADPPMDTKGDFHHHSEFQATHSSHPTTQSSQIVASTQPSQQVDKTQPPQLVDPVQPPQTPSNQQPVQHNPTQQKVFF